MARRKAKRRPWDLVEIDIACRAKRGEIPAVARRLDRTVASVTSLRCKHRAGPPKRPWEPEEDKSVDFLVLSGVHVQAAAKELGRSRVAAYKRRGVRRAMGEEVPEASRWMGGPRKADADE